MKTKMNLLRLVVISTALYGCESWTLTPNLEKRIAAFEMRCFRRLIQIPYTEHRTNISVTQEVTSMIGVRTADTNRQTPQVTVVWTCIQTRTLSRTLYCKDLYQVNELEVVQRPVGLIIFTHGLA